MPVTGLRPTEIVELLGREWPALAAAQGRAAALGMRWDLCSTPFGHCVAGRVVAHVGVLELLLIVDGVVRRVAGVHGAVTDPAHRDRGLAGGLLEAALAFVDARWPTALLTAGTPRHYRTFGFVPVVEHRFAGPVPPRTSWPTRGAPGMTP